jgi:hypothetical protein
LPLFVAFGLCGGLGGLPPLFPLFPLFIARSQTQLKSRILKFIGSLPN